jgi:SAM-dependent methyltransferase
MNEKSRDVAGSNVRRAIKRMFPALIDFYRGMRLRRLRRPFSNKSVAETFAEVYRTNWWGPPDDGPFNSGHGSRNEFATRYADLVTTLIQRERISSIVDIGCGDFKVSSKIQLGPNTSYIGMDVVPDLIDYHQRTSARENVKFICADAIEADLPPADLCLIRQVLQHLSNEQIAKILAKCGGYRYLLITEDLYTGPDARPNLDAPHGPTTRWAEKSGVYVDLPPYNLKGEVVLEIPATENASIRTLLIKNN